MPKFIDIEGTNGSGKQTQAQLLTQYFKNIGYKAIMISFPNYESDGCMPVKMYLSGVFGANSMDMDAYQSSVLFAVDRLTTLKTLNLNDFDFVVFDRYINSNLIHQAIKTSDEKALNEFIKYWQDFEYNKLKLPKPDMICFINMPYEKSKELMQARQLKFGEVKDVEESNEEAEKKAREVGLQVANKLNWKVVNCVVGDKLLSKEEIHQDIVSFVLSNLNKPAKKRRKTNKNKKVQD